MTRTLRLLLASPPPPPALEQLNSDFVVILAALLCALICFLGLVAVARCAWLRRFANQRNPPPPPAAANKGLKKKVLRSLPTQPYSPHFAQADCAICLAEFADGDQLRVLPQCGHGFHVACIDTWLGSHSSCPSCRQILVVGRCRKCGGVPPESGASGSSEVRRKEREDGEAQLPQYLP
uniref:RING-type domain-containing protein n=1 Tax=Kalanchoe fedtschenkoi TaxID=63787 RepID=A0A7N1A2N3_KALFE